MENKFLELLKLNVNDKTEKRKNGSTELTYLSWSYAVAEFTKAYPDFKYEIKMFNGLPYVYDENTGYMVFTSITAEEQTKEMWLPVMNSANKAMKKEKYTYMVKKIDKYTGEEKLVEMTVEPATMFDINKTIMRCLVKNMAMFGLGLYIYSGEDLPEQEQSQKQEEKPTQKKKVEKITVEQINQIRALEINEKNLCTYYKVEKLEDLSFEQAKQVIKLKMKNVKKGA